VQSVAEIKAVLAQRGDGPKRALGQNFLIDHSKIVALLERAAPGPGSLVLEVGPGTGTLTDELAASGADVLAVELDEFFVEHIRRRFASTGRVRVHRGDCLERKGDLNVAASSRLDEMGASERGYTLIANLPYNAASGLMVALAWDRRCLGQHVTIQRDVAQRVRAEVGTRDYSALTVMLRAVCDARRIATLPPGCFWPSPKVTSEMISIEPRAEAAERIESGLREPLERLCRRLFTSRRKTLRSILGDIAWPAGIDPGMRPEVVAPEELIVLARRLDGEVG